MIYHGYVYVGPINDKSVNLCNLSCSDKRKKKQSSTFPHPKPLVAKQSKDFQKLQVTRCVLSELISIQK